MDGDGIEPDLMTIKELTDRLGLSDHKVQEMQRQNELPFPVVRIGGRVMVLRRAYTDWLSQYSYDPENDPSNKESKA